MRDFFKKLIFRSKAFRNAVGVWIDAAIQYNRNPHEFGKCIEEINDLQMKIIDPDPTYTETERKKNKDRLLVLNDRLLVLSTVIRSFLLIDD